MNRTRHQQLLANIQRLVSQTLLELNHELFHEIVVTQAHLSNNGRECRIYVVTAPENFAHLITHRAEIQHLFQKQFVRKIVPRLTFYPDPGDAERLEEFFTPQKS